MNGVGRDSNGGIRGQRILSQDGEESFQLGRIIRSLLGRHSGRGRHGESS